MLYLAFTLQFSQHFLVFFSSRLLLTFDHGFCMLQISHLPTVFGVGRSVRIVEVDDDLVALRVGPVHVLVSHVREFAVCDSCCFSVLLS